MNKKGIFLAMLSALIYGFTPVLCAFTYKMGNNALTLTFFRSLFVIPILGFIMWFKKISFLIKPKELFYLVFIGIFGGVLTTLLLYKSYNYIQVGTATTLHFLYPLFVFIICLTIYKEKIHIKQILALLLSIIGISFFINLNDLKVFQGIIMSLISGITFSIYLVGMDKTILKNFNGFKLAFYISILVACSLFIYGTLNDELVLYQQVNSYVYMLFIALLAQLVAVVCLKLAIFYIGSSQVSILSMLEPISSIVFGMLFLKESVTFNNLIGCCIIICGMYILIKK